MLQIYQTGIEYWFLLGSITFLVLLKIPAPYGKFSKSNWGSWFFIMIPSQLGWVIMEIMSPIMIGYFFLTGPIEKSLTSYIFLILWLGHYFNRSIIYPIRQKNPSKMPLSNNMIKDSQNILDNANTIIHTPNPATASNNFFP